MLPSVLRAELLLEVDACELRANSWSVIRDQTPTTRSSQRACDQSCPAGRIPSVEHWIRMSHSFPSKRKPCLWESPLPIFPLVFLQTEHFGGEPANPFCFGGHRSAFGCRLRGFAHPKYLLEQKELDTLPHLAYPCYFSVLVARDLTFQLARSSTCRVPVGSVAKDKLENDSTRSATRSVPGFSGFPHVPPDLQVLLVVPSHLQCRFVW